MPQGNSGYGDQAAVLLAQYEALDFAVVHQRFLSLLPTQPCAVLDVGAGSGRDAAHFAALGCEVVAVEPTRELREGGMALHADQPIRWVDDRLPDLTRLAAVVQTFDVVMLSAVWMHLDAAERETGMRRLASLTHTGARVFMSLRHGPVPVGRVMYEVSGEETTRLAAEFGFQTLYHQRNPSVQAANRAAGIEWTTLVFER